MSEALNKFIIGKAKTRATFDKKFSGQDGALSLMELVGDAPKGVQKQAQKIFQANADDVEKAVSEIANLAYGSGTPAKKTGIQGKTAAKPEVIEGNLPQNDGGVVADPPKAKKSGKPKSEEESLETARQSQAFQAEREAAMTAASEPRGQRKAAAKKELEAAQAAPEVDDGELDTSIGQFVPAEGLGEADPNFPNQSYMAGAGFMPPLVDPRTSMMVGANPTPSAKPSPAGAFDMQQFLSDPSLQGIGADGTTQAAPPAPNTPAPIEPKADLKPASQPDLSSQDMDYLSSMGLDYLAPAPTLSQMDLSDLIGGGTAKPQPKPTMYGPFSDGLFDMNRGTALEPPADQALPGTISPDGGFLGMDQSPSMFNREGGFMGGDYGPSQFNDAGGAAGGEYGPPGSMAPPQKRPPFYDPNRTMGQWWNEPGPVSRANEFLYQRGMPAGIARAAQPTASVIDKSMKVLGPAAVGLGAGYGALQGMGAIANMGAEGGIAPPSEEEMAQTDAALAAAEARVRQMMQPPKPASAPPQAPVK
jgi:hypothetical protein